jgi:hypothetical protein
MSFNWQIVSRSPPGIYPGGLQLFGTIRVLIVFQVAQACCRITTGAHAHAHAHTEDCSLETFVIIMTL